MGVVLDYKGQQVDMQSLLESIFQHELAAQYHPWFFTYHGSLKEKRNLEAHLRSLRSLLKEGDISVENRRILDAGCGFGITALTLGLMGAGEVHGIDCHEGMIQTFKTYLSFLPYKLPLYPVLGDVAELPYPNESLDLILSIEAISHYKAVDQFLDEAHRTLKKGGVLLVYDGNNESNPVTTWRTRRIWNAFENGPATDNIFGHQVKKPYVEMRREMIIQAFPSLTTTQVELCAKGTFGMWGEQIIDACKVYTEMNIVPASYYQSTVCPVHPFDGQYIEFLMKPFQLKRRIEARGFKAAVVSYFGGARGGIVELANRMLSWGLLTPFTIYFARAFRIVAWKK
jgi:ubiquinone/menaquinone biosynthesis C-methylase UbiE